MSKSALSVKMNTSIKSKSKKILDEEAINFIANEVLKSKKMVLSENALILLTAATQFYLQKLINGMGIASTFAGRKTVLPRDWMCVKALCPKSYPTNTKDAKKFLFMNEIDYEKK